MLNTVEYGVETERPTLIIAHGLFGSARNWGVIAKRLSSDRRVLAVDMRNHANSFRDPDHSYRALASDLAAVARATGRPVDLLGHSMGGKAAMVAALCEPDLFHKLIVADIAPVTYSHTQMPILHAIERLDLSRLKNRQDADRHLSADLPDKAVRAFILQSLDLSGDTPKWTLNVEVLIDQMPQIMGFPTLEAAFEKPALFLSGGDSTYVTPDSRGKIKALFPQAKFVKILNAGHWLHAEQPRAFEDACRAFLNA